VTDEKPTSQELRANAKAEKAREKALRPWFKKKRFIIPIVLVALAIGSRGVSSESDNSSSQGQSQSQSPTSSSDVKTPGFGDKVSDGNFEFTVKSAKCGIGQVGDSTLGKKAQGQYCEIAVTVTNIGNEAATMFTDNQTVFDDKGRKFSPDSGAMIYLPEENSPWLTDINPGNTLKGILLFDVPEGITLDHIELHDSMYSDGVSVSLK